MKRVRAYLSMLLRTSFFTRFVLAISVGIGAKIFSMLIFPIYYFGTPLFLNMKDSVHAAGHSTVAEHAALIPFVSVLILAPVIENLVIPLIFWICKKVPKRNAVAITLMTLLAFWLHPPGSMSWTGASFFFCYAFFYAKLLPVCPWPEAYAHTAVAHFVTNLIAVIFILT